MRETDDLYLFWQDDFSQWSDIGFVDGNGKSYISCGQYMMAQKAKLFDDTEAFNLIRSSDSPQEQQELGRKVKNFDSEVWHQRKLDIVFRGNYLKFLWNDELQQELLATGSKILANASPDDLVWGIEFEANAAEATQPDLWRGQSLLGEILMQVREAFRHHEPIFKAEKRISDLQQTLTPAPQYHTITEHTDSVSNLPSAHGDELERNQILEAWMQTGVGNDFVKVSQEGDEFLARNATEWSGVYDQNTGLLWQNSCSTSRYYWGGKGASMLAYISKRGTRSFSRAVSD